MPILYEKAPAKINLTLDVLYKRPDHFHEVEMVMTTVDLADYVGLRLLNQQKILIKTTDSFIPNDQRNLAYQAAKLLMDRFDIKTGVEIDIHKQIPVAAGLAGGSTDAAATLRGLNRLWKLNLSVEELAELGAEIGSDIPFCVHGGTALATGRGEVLKPLSAPPNCWVILAKPAISVSTGNIYGSLTLDEMEHPNTQAMIEALEAANYVQMCDTLDNVLETVTLPLHPEVDSLKRQMKKFGADAVLMSGSGPTVFGLVKTEEKARKVCNGLKGFCPEVYAVRMLG
ncbi:MAG TPA: 4-(cytidine 5'-diphospho)-2-C-methyl-D-erythritol kinase [Sporosarcina sp.]|nr:4-(cytidine 5'-diphospho)-2-C-methyl-D-erythritol kinase [Sporosarcina sp.]